MLEFQDVSISYKIPGGKLPAVNSASADCPEGAISALIGPSGCGKTSLIQAAAGLRRADSGRILVGGREILSIRPNTAVIFQDFGLLPWKTVEENITLPLALKRVPRESRHGRIAPILDELGLSDFRSFYPARLSGGMRQRVAIARALAVEPDLLLMDEPFSSLDTLTRESLQESLLEVVKRRKMSVLIVTHSTEEAAFLADRIFVMQGKAPGAITATVDASSSAAQRGPGFRGSEEYFALCVALRRRLSGHVAGEDL